MMAIIKNIDLGSLESICKILGDTNNGISGTEISKYLAETSIKDPQLNSTKWKRLYDALSTKQSEDRCSNNILAFIKYVLRPSRHIHRKEWFKNIRTELNYVLSFEGFELTESGDIRETDKVKTFSEAEERAQNLRKTLLDRKIHSDVLTFCKAELLVDNYFHAVFEATKSIAEKISTLPKDKKFLHKIERLFADRNKMAKESKVFDWAMAELMAYERALKMVAQMAL